MRIATVFQPYFNRRTIVGTYGAWIARVLAKNASPGKATVRTGLIAAVPIVLGYFPIAFSVGVAATKAAGTGAPKHYASAWAFGLTDDVFGAALGVMARGRRFSEPAMFGLGIAADAAWLSGTAFGPMPGAAR